MKIPNLIAVEQRYTKIVLDYHPRQAAASFLFLAKFPLECGKERVKPNGKK